ncbi:MAG: hypothetical protein ACFFD4_09800 [Candidatus Odinarchaeota archaeon]
MSKTENSKWQKEVDFLNSFFLLEKKTPWRILKYVGGIWAFTTAGFMLLDIIPGLLDVVNNDPGLLGTGLRGILIVLFFLWTAGTLVLCVVLATIFPKFIFSNFFRISDEIKARNIGMVLIIFLLSALHIGLVTYLLQQLSEMTIQDIGELGEIPMFQFISDMALYTSEAGGPIYGLLIFTIFFLISAFVFYLLTGFFFISSYAVRDFIHLDTEEKKSETLASMVSVVGEEKTRTKKTTTFRYAVSLVVVILIFIVLAIAILTSVVLNVIVTASCTPLICIMVCNYNEKLFQRIEASWKDIDTKIAKITALDESKREKMIRKTLFEELERQISANDSFFLTVIFAYLFTCSLWLINLATLSLPDVIVIVAIFSAIYFIITVIIPYQYGNNLIKKEIFHCLVEHDLPDYADTVNAMMGFRNAMISIGVPVASVLLVFLTYQ